MRLRPPAGSEPAAAPADRPPGAVNVPGAFARFLVVCVLSGVALALLIDGAATGDRLALVGGVFAAWLAVVTACVR